MEKEKLTEYQIQVSLPAHNQELGLNNKEKKDDKKG